MATPTSPACPPCPVCGSAARSAKPIHVHAMCRCEKCDLIYAANREVPANLYEEAYTDHGEYAGLLAGARVQAEGGGKFDWMHRWVIDRVKPFGQCRALDLGCGVGSALYLAKRAGWQPFGQDISTNALRVAREVFGVTTFEYPAEQIAREGRRFELVTAFNLVEHVPDPGAYLRTVRQLVTDDGYFGIAVPNYNSYAMRHTTEAQWLPPYHLTFFTLKTLGTTLERAGFRLVDHKIKFVTRSGIEGPRWRPLAMAPYLVANALIGRLRGHGIVAIAKAT